MHHTVRTRVLQAMAALALWLAGGPAAAQVNEFCFGAAGMQCGGVTGQAAVQGVAFCLPVQSPLVKNGICKVHGGSWEHDTCCFANRNGVACGGNDSTRACEAAWNKSIHRTTWGYYWFRATDYTRPNPRGVIETALYCAPSGAHLHRNDRVHCCNGAASAVPADFWARVGRPSLWRCQ
jgi:hypothetical protein